MESGILLRGGFSAGSSYSITINKNLQGVLWVAHLATTTTVTFLSNRSRALVCQCQGDVPDLERESENCFANCQYSKNKSFPFYQIYENNDLAFMNNNRYEDWQGEENGYSYVTNDYEPERYGNKIMDREHKS